MMIQSFTKMLQSKRIACCIILLLGMTLPAEAAGWFDTVKRNDDKFTWGPWSFMTLVAFIATIVLAFTLLVDDGGNSQFLKVMGIAAFGSFALGAIVHYKCFGGHTIAREKELFDYRKANDGYDKIAADRFFRSKTFAFSAWCILIVVVSIYFLSQGDGEFAFMGGEKVVGLEVNSWLVAALSFGVSALTLAAVVVSCLFSREKDVPKGDFDYKKFTDMKADNYTPEIQINSEWANESNDYSRKMEETDVYAKEHGGVEQPKPGMVNVTSGIAQEQQGTSGNHEPDARRRLGTLQLVLRDLEEAF